MRRPNRHPYYDKMEDITNWSETVDYLVRLNGSYYEAVNGTNGKIDSKNANAATVIQYTLDNTTRGTVKVVSDVSLDTTIDAVNNVILDFTGHRVTITADVDFYKSDNAKYAALKNIEIYCPDNYTKTILNLDTTTGSMWWCNYENIMVFDTYENYTYTGLKLYSPGSNSIRNCYFRNLTFWNVNKGIHFKTDTALGWMGVNLFEHIYVNHFVIGMDFEIFNDPGYGPNRNLFSDVSFQTSANSTHGVKDTCNAANTFLNCVVSDWAVANAPVAQWSIHANANNTLLICATQDTEEYTDAGTATMILGQNAEMFLKYINRGADNQDIAFFKDTTGNPWLYLYGNDGGTERSSKIGVISNGALQITNNSGAGQIKILDDGRIEMNPVAPGDILYFAGSGSGENRYLDIHGRNNANSGVQAIKIRWGGTADDEGEITTDAGDLYLNPTGVVKFGTRTATGDTATNGYVTIKDAAGNTVKLATVA